MKTISLYILLIYFLFLVIISVLSYRRGFLNMFRTENRIPWFIAGFSIFLINPDSINILSKMGIVAEEGYSGLWIFYSAVLGTGFLPILFAPLWSRLKFMTDNQFILLRFSGRSARILHLFRAAYVGYLVVALFIAQIFIAFSKLLMVFFEISYEQSFIVISVLLIFLIAKNSLRLKLRTDFFNGLIYLFAFAAGAYYVVDHYGGLSSVYSTINTEYPEYIRLFPEKFSDSSFGSLQNVLVYFLIQWWSINVLDGAGPEAQRFMNVKSPFQAFKAAFLPLILFSLVFLLQSFVIDAGIIMVNQTPGEIPLIDGVRDTEAAFIHLYKDAMPAGIDILVFLAFMVGFLAFLESFINWGSGFVVVDVFKTYLFKNRTDRFYTMLSYAVMLIIGFSGVLIAWYNTHLLGLQKFIFSMGAGVGPVFVLRWFWWRINAWSQFTAMLASLFFAVGWDVLYNSSEAFSKFVNFQVDNFDLSYFTFKLLCLTIIVSICWISVTYMTRPDDRKTLMNFVKRVRPGGFWKGLNKGYSQISWQKALLLVFYPIISILPFLVIWQFKFGSSAATGIMMILAWIFLLVFTINRMRSFGK